MPSNMNSETNTVILSDGNHEEWAEDMEAKLSRIGRWKITTGNLKKPVLDPDPAKVTDYV